MLGADRFRWIDLGMATEQHHEQILVMRMARSRQNDGGGSFLCQSYSFLPVVVVNGFSGKLVLYKLQCFKRTCRIMQKITEDALKPLLILPNILKLEHRVLLGCLVKASTTTTLCVSRPRHVGSKRSLNRRP